MLHGLRYETVSAELVNCYCLQCKSYNLSCQFYNVGVPRGTLQFIDGRSQTPCGWCYAQAKSRRNSPSLIFLRAHISLSPHLGLHIKVQTLWSPLYGPHTMVPHYGPTLWSQQFGALHYGPKSIRW